MRLHTFVVNAKQMLNCDGVQIEDREKKFAAFFSPKNCMNAITHKGK